MTKNKTPRNDATTSCGATEPVNCLLKEYNTNNGKMQPKIAPVLLHGRENALTAKQLAEMLGMTARQITAAVRHDRILCRIPILSATDGKRGFFLPDCNPQTGKIQIELQCEKLRRRAIRVLELLSVFSPCGEVDGQMNLFKEALNGEDKEQS